MMRQGNELNGSRQPTTDHPEEEHTGPIWTHPYVMYVLLTTLLFGFLVFSGWLAWTQGWLPKR